MMIRVLDIATGIGEPAISTEKLLAKMDTLPLQISTEMLAIAEERARSPGLNDIFT